MVFYTNDWLVLGLRQILFDFSEDSPGGPNLRILGICSSPKLAMKITRLFLKPNFR